ncbi:MAG: phosphoribosylglycinamide formyltransferase [Nitrososphaeraceae archaeon]|jgi:phosphoribosylglycinamide formyltransferase-1|nr:phosphoribosylglycinamide formyltransferase [Nitrososphaeraceae archaeon]MDW0135500.1 phosphoribosylglycinamide formyltransferase [Nitrososphaeraceae archaeon]MDW0156120.1 phosphoribosylglycinamide formyltransferase [Nitrososphaeraceae archaeon]
MINLGILISGRGSNMESILNFLKENNIADICPKIVISSKTEAEGLKKASKFGVPTRVVSNNAKGWDYDSEIINILQEYDVNPENGLVCLAGYMRLLSPEFVRKYKMRIMNIHPSLLPSFPGLNSQKKALDYGVKVTGCTVHFVDEGLDSGPVIAQKHVTVLESDTFETLSERILVQEHILYPYCVKLFSEKRLLVEGRRVIVS